MLLILTDGLDGLAIGPIITSALTLALLAYLAGHKEFSEYLYLPYIAHAGELSVMMSAIIGAGVGFLWYNSFSCASVHGRCWLSKPRWGNWSCFNFD